MNYGTHLHRKKRRYVSRLGAPRANQPPPRQVRQNATRQSQKAPPRHLHHASHLVYAQSAPLRNRAGGKPTNRTHPLPVGKRARHHRRTKSRRPAPLDTENEQCQTLRGGNRAKRDYLSLKQITAESDQMVTLGGFFLEFNIRTPTPRADSSNQHSSDATPCHMPRAQ